MAVMGRTVTSLPRSSAAPPMSSAARWVLPVMLSKSTTIFTCGREDLNLHPVARTSTSSWRVYLIPPRPHERSANLVPRVASHVTLSTGLNAARGVLGLAFAGGVLRPASLRATPSPRREHNGLTTR